jgi:16S rRNA (cytosine1402-N4)-methyltransferase
VPRRANFAEVAEVVAELAPDGVDGLLLDLGVSSHQLDSAERGFSLKADGPLDMRMDPDAGLTAAEIVNTWGEEELARLFFELGEERKSRAVARALVQRRAERPFERTLDLAEVVARVVRKAGKIHPATRVFQALRLQVNGELEVLRAALAAAPQILRPGGRLVVISFHSLEDRIVKQFLRGRGQAEIDRPEWPAPRPNPDFSFEVLTSRPVTAGERELSANPRARSAKLRAATKLPTQP